MAVPLRSASLALDDFDERIPVFNREMIGDVSRWQMHACNKPPFNAGSIIVDKAYPRDVRMRLHERHEQQASVLIQFVERMISIGDLSDFTRDVQCIQNAASISLPTVT